MHFLVLSLTSSQTCRAFQKSTDPRTYLFSAFFSFLFLIVRYEQANPAPREDPLRPRAVRKYGEAVTDFDPPPVRALPIRKNFRNFRASTKKFESSFQLECLQSCLPTVRNTLAPSYAYERCTASTRTTHPSSRSRGNTRRNSRIPRSIGLFSCERSERISEYDQLDIVEL